MTFSAPGAAIAGYDYQAAFAWFHALRRRYPERGVVAISVEAPGVDLRLRLGFTMPEYHLFGRAQELTDAPMLADEQEAPLDLLGVQTRALDFLGPQAHDVRRRLVRAVAHAYGVC